MKMAWLMEKDHKSTFLNDDDEDDDDDGRLEQLEFSGCSCTFPPSEGLSTVLWHFNQVVVKVE